jgi:hypothetical protein
MMNEKKIKRLQELGTVLKNLSLVTSMKGKNNNMKKIPKPFSKRIIKAYKSELLDRVAKEFDKRQALEKELEQVQSTFRIYRKELINLTSFINQELEELDHRFNKGGE